MNETAAKSEKPKVYAFVKASCLTTVAGYCLLYFALWISSDEIGGIAMLIGFSGTLCLLAGLILAVLGIVRNLKSGDRWLENVFAVVVIYVILPSLSSLLPHPYTLREVNWSQGRAMMTIIATRIRDYALEHEGASVEDFPKDLEGLGFEPGDLEGSYFNRDMLSFEVESLDPLRFSVTARNDKLDPQEVMLDEDGVWSKIEGDG